MFRWAVKHKILGEAFNIHAMRRNTTIVFNQMEKLVNILQVFCFFLSCFILFCFILFFYFFILSIILSSSPEFF